jgi:dTDP-L-rhamnose 4-epimerase
MRVLVTGGAGFIGAHLADALLDEGHEVVVYDSLDAQVHGPNASPPSYLSPDVRFIAGDVRDIGGMERVILGDRIEAIFHEAAAVGVGQSMYDIRRYVDVNCVGTATILDVLANNQHNVEKLIVASSMSIYGEGSYWCEDHGIVSPTIRSVEQLDLRKWEMPCPECGLDVEAAATAETKPLFPTSIYATTKRDQEEMVLNFGQAYELPTVALRYFNAYGTRQSLSNPYTGVAAIFASSLLNGNPPRVFEDGHQSRDFTHVSDVVAANLLALKRSSANFNAFNVGTGQPTSVLRVAEVLAHHLDLDIKAETLDQFRAGDIRHCYADTSLAANELGFTAKVVFDDGMRELTAWLVDQESHDLGAKAMGELNFHRLTR